MSGHQRGTLKIIWVILQSDTKEVAIGAVYMGIDKPELIDWNDQIEE